MPDRPEFIPPDLTRTTEATRRALYEIVKQVHFSPAPGEVLAAKEAGEWYPVHDADESELAVVFLAGRWFAYWRCWDALDDAPDDQHWQVLRLVADLSRPLGVEMYEV
jgi:hypothetical protein